MTFSRKRDVPMDRQTNGLTDQRTNGPTDGRTDKASYTVACPQLKTEEKERISVKKSKAAPIRYWKILAESREGCLIMPTKIIVA